MKARKKKIIKLIMIITGCVLDALGFVLFIEPSGMITAGASGLGLFFWRLFGIPVAVFVLIFNSLMLILGYFFLGKKFATTAALGSFLYPITMNIIQRLVKGYYVTDDIFLCMVYGGLLVGIGVGLILRAGSSSGGMDIPPQILHKKLRIPIPVSLYFADIVILGLQATQVRGLEILYGILLIVLSTITISKVMIIGKTMIEIKIITAFPNEIQVNIYRKLHRGVTLIKSTTGYLGKDTNMVLSVISHRQLIKVDRILRETDPNAFMIVSNVSEVNGNGFPRNL